MKSRSCLSIESLPPAEMRFALTWLRGELQLGILALLPLAKFLLMANDYIDNLANVGL